MSLGHHNKINLIIIDLSGDVSREEQESKGGGFWKYLKKAQALDLFIMSKDFFVR